MKGLVLKYPILILIVIVVIIVSIEILKYFSEQVDYPNDINFPSNAQYLCVQLNDTEIDFEDFQDVLYGFLKGQCNDFFAKTKQRINIDDIKRFINTMDSSIQVIQIDECILPKVNTHTVYVNFNEIERERNIYLKRREIDNSDVLICVIE